MSKLILLSSLLLISSTAQAHNDHTPSCEQPSTTMELGGIVLDTEEIQRRFSDPVIRRHLRAMHRINDRFNRQHSHLRQVLCNAHYENRDPNVAEQRVIHRLRRAIRQRVREMHRHRTAVRRRVNHLNSL